MAWNDYARAGLSREGFLAMKRDLARNGRTEVCEGSHDNSPQIPPEKVVIDGQGKQGAEVRGQKNEHTSDSSRRAPSFT